MFNCVLAALSFSGWNGYSQVREHGATSVARAGGGEVAS